MSIRIVFTMFNQRINQPLTWNLQKLDLNWKRLLWGLIIVVWKSVESDAMFSFLFYDDPILLHGWPDPKKPSMGPLLDHFSNWAWAGIHISGPINYQVRLGSGWIWAQISRWIIYSKQRGTSRWIVWEVGGNFSNTMWKAHDQSSPITDDSH